MAHDCIIHLQGPLSITEKDTSYILASQGPLVFGDARLLQVLCMWLNLWSISKDHRSTQSISQLPVSITQSPGLQHFRFQVDGGV